MESCPLESVPTGLKGEVPNNKSKIEKSSCESNATKQLEMAGMSEINRTISSRATEEFKKWKKHDDNREFCDIEDENDDQLVFIDLLKV